MSLVLVSRAATVRRRTIGLICRTFWQKEREKNGSAGFSGVKSSDSEKNEPRRINTQRFRREGFLTNQSSFFLSFMSTTIPITEKRRVALAYDGTEDAQKLFDWSLKNIIRPESDHLILLSAVERDSDRNHQRKSSGGLPMLSTSPSRMSDAIQQAESHAHGGATARERLEAMGNHLRQLQISSEEHILWGDAKTLIPRFTQQHPVDLLVVGSRGLGAVKSVFLGSVSDKCIHECPCPVLVVRNATI